MEKQFVGTCQAATFRTTPARQTIVPSLLALFRFNPLMLCSELRKVFIASHTSVTKPVWVSIAPISNSTKVGTERIASALGKNVILSEEILEIGEYPLFPIAASRRLKRLFSSEGG